MKTFSRTIELTEAQIEGLNTGSPVEFTLLSDGLPSDKAFVITGAQAWKTSGGASTDGGAEINVYYAGGSTPIAVFSNVDDTGSPGTGFLGAASINYIQAAAISTAVAVPCAGLGVTISSSAAIACATGTKAKIKLDCQVIDL